MTLNVALVPRAVQPWQGWGTLYFHVSLQEIFCSYSPPLSQYPVADQQMQEKAFYWGFAYSFRGFVS